MAKTRSPHNIAAYVAICEVLAKHDPQGLIRMGAPLDEYSPEAHPLSDKIQPPYSVDKIAEAVHQVFTEMFAPMRVGTRDEYMPIAVDICEALTKLK